MFLKRLLLVHWGNIPDGEFELGPINLFSGANGSGKTTAADAIQTVMTAAHENLFHYNPGQEETTQRGRGGKNVRTLASYVLGCDDGSYARTQPTDGYVAAIFHPTKGESAEPFTALVAVSAHVDSSGKQAVAREDEIAFFVLPGIELTQEVLLQRRAGATHVVLLTELEKGLIKRFRKQGVERYDQKRAYLRRLYGALRGKRDSVSEREAMAAAKAFSRFMAYKPVQSINQFVADEVLERRDLGDAVRSVSSQLKVIHDMEREAQRYTESADLLEQAGHQAQTYIERWVERVTLDCSLAQSVYLQRQHQYLGARHEHDNVTRQLRENASELKLAEQRRDQNHSTIVLLEAQRQNVEPLRRKDELQHKQQALTEDLRQAAQELLCQDHRLQQNLQAVRALEKLLAAPALMAELPDLTDMHSRRLVEQAKAAERVGDIDLPGLLQRDLTGDLAKLERHLDDARLVQRLHNELSGYWRNAAEGEANRRDRLSEAQQRRRQRYEQLSAQRQQKQQDIERLEARQAVYPAYVDRALAAIRAQLPQADARVLCDHIDVTEPRWQSAIEGYMGGARFGIVVDEDYEADAIRVVRSMPGRDNRARVIQGAKALRDAARLKPPAHSILHVMKFTHRVVEAYVAASYGAVERVESAEELRNTARGVTADGMGSGGYSMFRCDIADADLVFGAAARERALKARRDELTQLTTERQEANDRLQEVQRLLEGVDRLQSLAYGDTLQAMLAAHRDLRSTELLLSQLDTSEWQDLDAQLERLQAQQRELWGAIAEVNRRDGELRTRLATIDGNIQRLSQQKEEAQEAMLAAEEQLRVLHTGWPQFDLEARLNYAAQEAKSLDAAQADLAREAIDKALRGAERAMDGILQQHNQKSSTAYHVLHQGFRDSYDSALFADICQLRLEIDRVYNLLKNNVLVEKHQHLRQLKTVFNNSFVSHLCQAIYQAIVDGRRQLELLNKELVNHQFGSDRERFRFAADWVPEYRDYWRFFEEVVKSPQLGESTGLFEAQFSAKSAAVRDALMELLLGTDEQKSQRELERIADYRNYHRYEIYKEVEGKPALALSEYGTGSGGQLETPAYIIRAASITSALRYTEGTNHLRMVLVDEAFSKMDETRSREVIDYLTRTLGLQLLFIMPTSKCGPFMDLISNEFVFAKVPSAPRGELHTRVLVDRKECNRDRIGELWAQHRRAVQHQAELDFMRDVLDAPAALGAPS